MAKLSVGQNIKKFQTLYGHSSDITCCDFVSISTIVTGSSDKTIRIWDWKSGLGFTERVSVSPLKAHKYQVTCVKVSPQGSLLASSSVDGTAVIWNVYNCQKLYSITQVNGDAIRVCRFSPDTSILITAGDNGAICVWDLVHRSLIKTIFDHEGTTQSLAFTSDSYYLISACSLEIIMIWNVQDLIDTTSDAICTPVAKLDNVQDMGVFCLDISKHIIFDKNNPLIRQYRLATSGTSNEIKIWLITTKSVIKNKLSTVNNCVNIELFDVYDGHTSSVTSVRYSNNGDFLLSTSVDKLVKIWDYDGNCLASLLGHSRYVNCAAISKDLSLIISGSNDKSVIVWDVNGNLSYDSEFEQIPLSESNFSENIGNNNNNNVVTLLEKLDDICDNAINSCCFFGKNLLAIGSGDKLIRIFKVSDSIEEVEFSPLEGHTYAINQVQYSNNGEMLASCSLDGCTIIWDTQNGEKLYSLPKNILSVKCCQFSPDNKTLLTAGDDEKAILWNISTMEKIVTFEGHLDTITSAKFTPDGKLSITVSINGDFRLWSIDPNRCIFVKEDAHEYGIQDCDISDSSEPIPNLTMTACQMSYLLATCGNDSLVKLWKISVDMQSTDGDMVDVKIWRSLHGHGGNAISVRFSHNSSEFVCSTATDRQARIWSIYSASCLFVLDHNSIVTSCSFNSDCSLLSTACLDKTLWIWKLPQQMIFQSAVADKIQNRSKPVINWTVSDVIKWLKTIGMIEVIPIFTNSLIDGNKLLTVPEEQLTNELDLDDEKRSKLIREIRWLKNGESKMEAANYLDIPHEFLCPITHEIMREPVICSDGFTYEKNAITEWFMSGKDTSPMTNDKLSNTDVAINMKLRDEIYEFLDMNEN